MNNTNEMTIEFRGMFFNGLRLFKSRTRSEGFYNELIEEGSSYSKGKYIDAVHEELHEEIHIKVSLSAVMQALSILGLIIAGFLGMTGAFLPALVVLGIGFASQVLHKHFKTRANELYTGRELSTQLVKMLFEN